MDSSEPESHCHGSLPSSAAASDSCCCNVWALGATEVTGPWLIVFVPVTDFSPKPCCSESIAVFSGMQIRK